MNDFCPFYFSQILGIFEKTSKKVAFLWPKTHFVSKNFYKNGHKI